MTEIHMDSGGGSAVGSVSTQVIGNKSLEQCLNETKSLNGYEFDRLADVWRIDAGTVINAGSIRKGMAPALAEGCLHTLAHVAQTLSPATCSRASSYLRDFLRFTSPNGCLQSITTTDLTNFRAHVFDRTGSEEVLTGLRSFIKSWHALRHPGIGDDVFKLLVGWRLKGKPAGICVSTMDPTDGPLEPTELHALTAGIRSVYERDLIPHKYFSLMLLLIYTGRRPSQIAHIKCLDLDDSRSSETGLSESLRPSRKLHLVHIPRAKQHATKFREVFRSVEVIEQLWEVLTLQRAMVAHRFDEMLLSHGWQLQNADVGFFHSQLPLFPSWRRISGSLLAIGKVRATGEHGYALTQLREAAKSKRWHMDGPGVNRVVERSAEMADVRARDGQRLNLFPYRLRYTKGTEAARAGHGREVISWLLDQNDFRSVNAYVKNLPEHAIPIDKALAKSSTLSKLATLFRGDLVDREADARGGDDPQATRILHKGMGAATCGNRIQCGMNRLPIPCYTCDHFQPWLDGPHEQVLDLLLRQRKERFEALGDQAKSMIEAVDPTIVAVIQVVQRCEARRLELEHSARIGHSPSATSSKSADQLVGNAITSSSATDHTSELQ